MNVNDVVRTELKRIASQIESLAHQAQTRLATGAGILDVANELVKNSITLTFSLGELYASEKQTATTPVVAASPKTRRASTNFHNVRDSRGRFVRNVRP